MTGHLIVPFFDFPAGLCKWVHLLTVSSLMSVVVRLHGLGKRDIMGYRKIPHGGSFCTCRSVIGLICF